MNNKLKETQHQTRKDVANTRRDVATHRRKDVALQRLYDGVLTILVLCTIAYTGLSAQTKEYRDLVILKDGTVLNGVHTLVTKDSLVVTTSDGGETTYEKKDVSEVMRKAFDPAKGYKDLVILKDGTVWNATQTLVTKDSLIVAWESGETSVYKKPEVSEVKKNVFDKAKGFRDTVTLKDGTVIEGAQTLVNRDSLIVFKEDGTAAIYLKKEVSDVTKGKAEVAVKAGQKFTSKTGIEMLPIPAGEFMMGCSEGDTECDDSEKPAHKVKITKSFFMGKYEVTQGQWKAVMGANPSSFNSCGDNCPVENVSWNDVKGFLVKLNEMEGGSTSLTNRKLLYRLPTEAEWEYAARGSATLTTRTSKYYASDLGSIAWYSENSGSKTQPVGKKKPNAFGLYDMLGNVWEWCEDWYGNYSPSDETDPAGASSGTYRVLRGGSWRYYAKFSRSSTRIDYAPDFRFNDYGFRVVVLP